jgi:hypothetical protein
LQSTSEPGADDFALRIQNRFRAAEDNVAAAQARLGVQLDARSRPAEVKVGDYMYLDGKHVPSQVPLKFAARWFGPFKVLAARGPVVQLDLPATLGKMSPWVNVRRLKFFEERDADLAGPDDGLVLPLMILVMRLIRFCVIGRSRVGVKYWCVGRGMTSLITSGFVVQCWRRMYLRWFLLTMRILVSLFLGRRRRNGRQRVRRIW